jgi:alkylhydroperoxidase/carboxymuconolactone decarboxylase family protein YurZ
MTRSSDAAGGRKPSGRVSADEMDAAWAYAADYFKGRLDSYELLARYRPEVVHGYMTLRQAAFNVDEDAALDRKTKELVILAIEIARQMSNPPPVGHAVKAIEAGATPAEVAEVASLCLLIGGMLTYQLAGKHALLAAEDRYAELNTEGQEAGPETADG